MTTATTLSLVPPGGTGLGPANPSYPAPTRPKQYDVANGVSNRNEAADMSEAMNSTAHLLPQGGEVAGGATGGGVSGVHREADAGVRLAGGPVRDSWFVGGGTLPPAYGEF